MNAQPDSGTAGLLTPDQLAERLKVSRQTVLAWARKGTIPATKISGRVVRFDLAIVYKALGINMSA